MSTHLLETRIATSNLSQEDKDYIFISLDRLESINTQKTLLDDMIMLYDKNMKSTTDFEVVLSTESVKIYNVSTDLCSFFKLLYIGENKRWVLHENVFTSLDTALLKHLELKHEGENGNFSKYASKMLNFK
jgi:hypothetical protein